MARRGADAWIGGCLVAAGGLTFVINAALTPLLPKDGEVLAAASPIFLARQGASALAAGFLLIAAAGLLFRPSQGAPR